MSGDNFCTAVSTCRVVANVLHGDSGYSISFAYIVEVCRRFPLGREDFAFSLDFAFGRPVPILTRPNCVQAGQILRASLRASSEELLHSMPPQI